MHIVIPPEGSGALSSLRGSAAETGSLLVEGEEFEEEGLGGASLRVE